MNPDPAQTSLELLLNISRELATSLDLPTVLERVLYHATQAVNAERGSLIALAANGQPVEAVMVVNGQRHHLSRLEVSDILDHGLAGWVASQREPVLVENTLEDERWQHRPARAGSEAGGSRCCLPPEGDTGPPRTAAIPARRRPGGPVGQWLPSRDRLGLRTRSRP